MQYFDSNRIILFSGYSQKGDTSSIAAGDSKKLFKGKAILLFATMQSGKSSLIESLLKELGKEWLYLNGDKADVW